MLNIITYQDFLHDTATTDRSDYIRSLINIHQQSDIYKIAVEADEYDHQKNRTIYNFVRTILAATGEKIIDTIAANNRIASNIFRRLNVQRNTYSLGHGITFNDDSVKKRLGDNFDTILKQAGYYSLIHGVSFIFWNVNRAYFFKITEFVPIYNEITGNLAAGIRYWQIDSSHPLTATLFLPEGYETYRDVDNKWTLIDPLRKYKTKIEVTKALGAFEVGSENYNCLPIVPLYGSELRQSTLVGMKQSIDSYDMIRSGFANDLSDCAQIYWIIKNAGGMSDEDLAEFRRRLLYQHIARTTNTDEDSDITPYTQEIPFQARTAYLEMIKAGIYADFGAFNVSDVSASAKTATEINAAYQPMDENADDYEYQIIDCVTKLLALQGITGDDAVPQFKRNRIANQPEQTTMVLSAAPYLDKETIISKLPFITDDEVAEILKRLDAEDMDRISPNGSEIDNTDKEDTADGDIE